MARKRGFRVGVSDDGQVVLAAVDGDDTVSHPLDVEDADDLVASLQSVTHEARCIRGEDD